MPAPGRAPVPPSRPPSSSAATPSRTTRISPCPSTWCTSASRRGARRWGPDGRPSARLPPSSSPSPTRTRARPGTASASTSTGPSRGSRGTWGRRADAPAPTFGGTPGGRAWRRARIRRSRGKIFPGGRSKRFTWLPSDYRSSNVGPSDSEKDCPSRRDSETAGPNTTPTPRLGVTAPSNDSESGGSHSPSPRASRRRQVRHSDVSPTIHPPIVCRGCATTLSPRCASSPTTPSSPCSASACSS
jgi:hypothetical protein